MVWIASLIFIMSAVFTLSLPFMSQARAVDIGQFSYDDVPFDLAERFARAVSVQPSSPAAASTKLPIWQEFRNLHLDAIVTPWPIINALQGDSSSVPVIFAPPVDGAPRFFVWLWHEQPSAHYLSFNWEQLGLTERGLSSLMVWGLLREGRVQRRMSCHWWSETKPGLISMDFLMIDAPQSENSISCLAAGLLRHVGNPLWSHIAQEFAGRSNAEVLPQVKRLYGCALRSQFNFVRSNSPNAEGPRRKEEYLSRLDEQVHRDCLPNT